jgi:hypothetical protein
MSCTSAVRIRCRSLYHLNALFHPTCVFFLSLLLLLLLKRDAPVLCKGPQLPVASPVPLYSLVAAGEQEYGTPAEAPMKT